jgi:hypothetical protein
MKAQSTAGKGQGWHKQSVRHSNARKTGTAGGTYAETKNTRLFLVKSHDNIYDVWATQKKDGKVIIHEDFNKEKQALRFANKYTRLKDSDGDGVPDKYDCQPNNPNKQDKIEWDDSYPAWNGESQEWKGSDNKHQYSIEFTSYGEGTSKVTTMRRPKKSGFINSVTNSGWETLEEKEFATKREARNYALKKKESLR